MKKLLLKSLLALGALVLGGSTTSALKPNESFKDGYITYLVAKSPTETAPGEVYASQLDNTGTGAIVVPEYVEYSEFVDGNTVTEKYKVVQSYINFSNARSYTEVSFLCDVNPVPQGLFMNASGIQKITFGTRWLN